MKYDLQVFKALYSLYVCMIIQLVQDNFRYILPFLLFSSSLIIYVNINRSKINKTYLFLLMGNKLIQQTQKIHHSKFGEVQILTRHNHIYMIMDIIVANSAILKQWNQNYQKQINKKELEFVLKPKKYTVQKIACGQSMKVKLQFEYFICDLKTEVMNRIKSKTFFEQSQLFYLLFLLLEISSQYETNNQKSGNIKPQNILINNSGEINLITKNSYPTNISNYTTSLRNQQITYLSPQEMCYLKQTIQNPSYNKSKAQAFSIGMTLLHLCVLENLDIIYDIKKKQIKSDKLEQYINLFKQDHKYSPFFKNIILILLNFDQMQRFSPTEIFVYLSPYQYEIKNLQFFQPDLALCETALNNYQHNNQLIKIISNPKTQTVHRLGSSILKSKISSKIQKSIEITFNHPLSSGISAKKRFNKSRQILRNDQIFCRNNINEQQQGLKGLETKKQKMNQNSVRKNQKTVQKSEELYQQNKKW